MQKSYGAGPDAGNGYAITAGEIRTIFNSTNCPLLKDKPKLLIINGGRGSKEIQENEPRSRSRSFVGLGISDKNYTDFLTVYSSVSGHVSMRDPIKGSVFIEVLCEVLLKYDGHDVSQLIPVVNGELMKRSARIVKTNGISVKLTETCIAEQTLTKQLCLQR